MISDPKPLGQGIKEKNSFRVTELDSLRGLAALGVLIFHYTYNQKEVNPAFVFKSGITGVDIFFMISGFVILLSITRISRLQDFIIYRFSRLYPTYWVCILITSVFVYIYDFTNFRVRDILINMTMIQPYFGVEDLDGSYWTLLVELLFYSWIIVVYLFKKIDNIENAGFITLVGILLYHYFRAFYPDTYAFVQAKFPIMNHFPLFFSGILFYKLKFNGVSAKVLVFMIISMLAAFYLHDKGGRAMYLISSVQHDLIIVFFHFVFTLLILGRLKFLVKPYLIFLGNISYSLYLLHQYIGRRIIESLVSEVHMNIYLAIVLALSFSILLAYLVTYYVEIPVIKNIRNTYKKYILARPVSYTDLR